MTRRSKVKWWLLGLLTAGLLFTAGSVLVPGIVVGTANLVASNDVTSSLRGLSESDSAGQDSLVPMIVHRVGISRATRSPVVVLKEKNGQVLLPIWIGPLEARAISVVVEGIEMPRPLTTDLLRSVLDQTGARVARVVINDFKGNTFYARIIVVANWQQIEIDARPSDAIGLALRVRAPIYADRSVLDRAGVESDDEAGETAALETPVPVDRGGGSG